jgi:uncharacterized protein (TIGR02145 family)
MKTLFSLLLGLSVIQAQVKEVKIGTQVWMAKNLNVSKFKNGDPIPQAKTFSEWNKASENQEPAWCYYNNDPANGQKYGKMYNWYAVNDSRGLAPAGYHIPTHDEWDTLKIYLDGYFPSGTKMKSTSGWKKKQNYYTEGANESGFNGLPGGYRDTYGPFDGIGKYGYWWSSTEYSSNSAWTHYLSYDHGDVSSGNGSKGDGFYVRCLRD